jgi:hypothetical protein
VLLRNLNSIHINPIDKPPLLHPNLDIIPAHLPLPHQAIVGVRPVLEPVGPPPLPLVVAPLVPELHGDLVVREGEQLLPEAVAVLALPFRREELDDLFAPAQEGGAVAPDAVGRVA